MAKGHLALLFILGSVTAIQPLSMDMYLPALPTIGRELHASLADTQMTVAIFFVGTGLGQLLFGPISDRFGRRGSALVGLAIYIAATAGCGLAGGIGSMIAFRLLQAVGVCSGQVVSRAMLADLFEPHELARFSSLLTMITLVAPIVAPLLGGFIFVHFGWRPIFLFLAIYGALVTALVAGRLPETRSHEARAVSRRESPQASYMAILRNWPLMRMILISACTSSGFFAYLAGSPHLIIDRFGVPASQFGWYFAANSLGLFVGSHTNRMLLRQVTPQAILRITRWLYLGFALLLLAGATWPVAGKWTVLVPLFLIIAVFPMVMVNSTAVAQGLDRQRAGGVAAVLGAIQGLLGASAIAATSALGDGSPQSLAVTMVTASAVAAALSFAPRRRRAAVS